MPNSALEVMTAWIFCADPWASHDIHTVSDWQLEVANGDTRRSYHDWLLITAEQEDDDAGVTAIRPWDGENARWWEIDWPNRDWPVAKQKWETSDGKEWSHPDLAHQHQKAIDDDKTPH